ncbi:unnamed protein product [Prunus armeniaca]
MTEQPKKEIPIKMLGNDKPFATIIKGRWYSVGKSGRPTLELTRTQKNRVQRQYCTFLKNKDNTQVPSKPAIHPTSPSINQLEPSLSQSQSVPTPVEGQEGWIKEYEEEQLDYEPSADDQTGLLKIGEQEDWTEQMEYDGELDEETEEKFRAVEGQENTLEGYVLSQETFECKLAEVEETPKQQISADRTSRTTIKMVAEQLCFSKPTKEMANHLRPLLITANFGGIPIPKVKVDGGPAINLLPYRLLIKMGRTENDLIPTCLTVTNFARVITKTHGILDVDVITPLLPLTMHCLAEIGSSRVYVFLPIYTSSWPSGMKRSSRTVVPMVSRPRNSLKKVWLVLYRVGIGPTFSTSKVLMFSSNQQERDRAVQSITNRLLVYWEEMKLFMHSPAINIAEFMHESIEEHEGNLQEEELEFAPAALDNSLPEVEDPL